MQDIASHKNPLITKRDPPQIKAQPVTQFDQPHLQRTLIIHMAQNTPFQSGVASEILSQSHQRHLIQFRICVKHQVAVVPVLKGLRVCDFGAAKWSARDAPPGAGGSAGLSVGEQILAEGARKEAGAPGKEPPRTVVRDGTVLTACGAGDAPEFTEALKTLLLTYRDGEAASPFI